MKILILRIWDADDHEFWSLHTNQESVDKQLHLYATARWEEEILGSNDLPTNSIINRFFSELDDVHWYEIKERSLDLEEMIGEGEQDYTFLSHRELAILTHALENTSSNQLAKQFSPFGDSQEGRTEMLVEVGEILSKLA